MNETLPTSLTENLVTILAWNDKVGKTVSQLFNPQLCDGELRVIAERCIDYWKVHAQAPKAHVPDLFSDILDDPQSKKVQTYRRLLSQMFDLREGVNTDYVLRQLRDFNRLQRMKAAIVTSAEQLNARQQMAIGEVEVVLANLLRAREIDFEPGMRLTDVDRLIDYLQTREHEFSTGISVLDKGGIIPYRAALLLILGATGTGKSWMCTHLGNRALLDRKRVLHVSLEMGEEQVAQRYLQNMFNVSKNEPQAQVQVMQKDTFGRVQEMATEKTKASFTFASVMLRDELVNHLTWGGQRYENLIIKRFPPRKITADDLNAYLDNLEAVERFVPDLLIVDYIGLMKIDLRNPRLSLGAAGMDLRAIGVERNLAVVAPQQVNRPGASARLVTHMHTAEDWSLTNTADTIISISQTHTEKGLGLSRLLASKVRDEEGNMICVITQNLRMGQFVLDDARMSAQYDRYIERVMEEQKHADDDVEAEQE